MEDRMFDRPPLAPDWVVGLWRRESIRFPDGTCDLSTQVLWGQTHTLYVDLRVPADRPDGAGRRSFDDYSLDELQRLSKQKGFAGHIVLEGDVCSWMRDIDYRPNTGRPDCGRLRRDGDVLYEDGEASSVIGNAYREVYSCERMADRCSVALRLLEAKSDNPRWRADAGSILVVIDDRFLFARPRSTALPPAETLRELVVAAGDDRQLIHSYLDCEIAFGQTGPEDDRWTVLRSTIPHHEGKTMLGRGISSHAGSPDMLRMDNDEGVLEWQVIESSLEPEELLRLFSR
jgi:hypothetical protein